MTETRFIHHTFCHQKSTSKHSLNMAGYKRLGYNLLRALEVAQESIVANDMRCLFHRCIDGSHSLQVTSHLFFHIWSFALAKYTSHKEFVWFSQRILMDSMLLLTKNGKSGPEKDETVQGVFDNDTVNSLLRNEKVASLGFDDLDLRIADFIQSLGRKANGISIRFPSGEISG